MQLLERYLQEVKRYLPAGERDDILRELSANILSEMDDREMSLGRPLAEDEQIAILRQKGSPVVVASRYRHDQQAFTFGRIIIGPALFPLYIKILILNLSITVVVASVVAIAISAHVGLSALFLPALLQFAAVTTIFGVLEQSQKKFHIFDQWNPRALPRVRDPLKISRASSFSGILSGLIFALCWLHVPGATYAVAYLFLGPLVRYFAPESASPLVFAASWQIFYLPILVLVLVSVAQHGLNFAFPRWTRNRLIVGASLSGLGLTVALLLFRAGDLLNLNPEITSSTQFAGLATIINQSVHYSMLLAAVMTTFSIAKQVRLALRVSSAPAPSHSTPQAF
jgi:hypothetical protein